MENIVIFAGTTEGRGLSASLGRTGISHTICVATDYGEEVLKDEPCAFAKVHKGRMNAEEMAAFFEKEAFSTVVDATHPYAQIVTENIRAAAKQAGIRYLRLLRETADVSAILPEMRYFENTTACAGALRETEGNILLTTGSKELSVFAETEGLRERLIARVLPGTESIGLCEKSAIPGKRIVAMQGPFSEEMNLALIHGFNVKILVTKMSGKTGGYGEKLSACAKAGIPAWIIGRPAEENGLSAEEVLRELGVELPAEAAEAPIDEAAVDGKTAKAAYRGAADEKNGSGKASACERAEISYDIVLAGIGMGDRGSMTIECAEAIRDADYLFGAARMIEPYTPRIEKKPYYLAKDIIPYLVEKQKEAALINRELSVCADTVQAFREAGNISLTDQVLRVVVLFSGDSGFFSGCEKMYHALKKAAESGDLTARVRIFPGISSISMLAAKTGVPYGNAAVLSLHGKKNWEEELLAAIRVRKHAFMLTSGREDLRAIGCLLRENGLEEATVTYGYTMGSENEILRTISVEECISGEKQEAPGQGLYTCLIQNPKAEETQETEQIPLTHGLPDGAFVRGKVPMTKEEVREIVISKLHLTEGSVVYDVGAGTGSIAIEIGRRAAAQEKITKTRIYAIEQNPDGIALIHENAARLGAKGLHVVEGKAPEALRDLPAPTHVFIGGSSGGMKDILKLIYEKNPSARVVLTSVTLETIAEMSEIAKSIYVKDVEFVTISAARDRKAGRYHLMTAENPVWICAFTFNSPTKA